MKGLSLPAGRVAMLQVSIVLLLISLCIGGCWYVWSKHQSLENHLVALQPRYARLAGLLLSRNKIAEAKNQAEKRLVSVSYSSDQQLSQAANDAQQRIRSVLTDSKLDVVSMQVMPGKVDGKFDRIGITARVEGDLIGIQNALGLLETHQPLVIVDEANIQPIGAVKPASAQKLSGQFTFSLFRVRA